MSEFFTSMLVLLLMFTGLLFLTIEPTETKNTNSIIMQSCLDKGGVPVLGGWFGDKVENCIIN